MNELLFMEIKIDKYDEKMSFWEQDLYYYLNKLKDIPKICNITSLFINKEDRNHGVVTKMLEEFCNAHEDYIIFLQAGASTKEYLDEPDEETLVNISDNLVKFYTKRGFININDTIGGYQFRKLMIYDNKLARNTILKMISINKKIMEEN